MKRSGARRILPKAACGVALLGLGVFAFDHLVDDCSPLAGWRRDVASRIDWPSGIEIRIRVLHEPR